MHYFQLQSIQHYLKASKKKELLTQKHIPIFSQVSKVCILCIYENDSQIREIIETIDRYENRQKKIHLFVYVPLKKTPSILQKSLFIDSILKSDITFWGKVNSKIKQKLWSQRYDILINANFQSHKPITHLLSLLTKADFKITNSEDYAHIYHLRLQMKTDDSLSYYIDTIEKYTKKLNGK